MIIWVYMANKTSVYLPMVFYRLSKSAAAHSESGNSCLLGCLLFARNIIHRKWVQYETEHKLGLKKSK